MTAPATTASQDQCGIEAYRGIGIAGISTITAPATNGLGQHTHSMCAAGTEIQSVITDLNRPRGATVTAAAAQLQGQHGRNADILDAAAIATAPTDTLPDDAKSVVAVGKNAYVIAC